MTSQPEPASPDAKQARTFTEPLRELVALVLLAANALFLFVGLIRFIVPLSDYSTWTGRAGTAFYFFAGIEAVALPVLAVLLATHVQPAAPKAKLITQVALGEYAFSAVFGLLTFLIATIGRLAQAEVGDALVNLLTRVGYLALLGGAALLVFRVWQGMYHVPKPKPQPGLYGQPQPGYPYQGYPQQPGYPAGQAGYPAQPGYGQPYGTGTPGQPQYPGAPQSAPPVGTPQYGAPYGTPQQSGFAEPTQALPRPAGDGGERTQVVNSPSEGPDQQN